MKKLILIPYRDRKQHLAYFIENTFPLFPENIHICIIEQDNNKLFNRGALINIGFLENENNYDIFYTQDVDTNPYKNAVEKYYNYDFPDDVVYGILNPPVDTLGAVTGFHKKHFRQINGFPNNFWGWGVEDKALQNRVEFHKIKIIKNLTKTKENSVGWFLEFRSDDNHGKRIPGPETQSNTTVEYNMFKFFSREKQQDRIKNSGGLDTIEYTITNTETIIKDRIFKIYVDF